MKTKLIFVGGFLGAGKTTLLGAISKILQSRGQKVGLITNDQAEGLVDTCILSANGTDVQEIAGSCFCCDFDGLMEAALYLRDIAGCDTIVAEPVGSCTDLSATLMQPLKFYYQQHFRLLPLSVVVDPFRFRETLEDKRNTTQGSGYIYLKQLEEADCLVINKIDLLTTSETSALEQLLHDKFPDHTTHQISALNGEGVQEWLAAMEEDQQGGTRIAAVDYDTYAKGEALMGWYNATFAVSHLENCLIPWAEFNLKFLALLQAVFQYEKTAIGHVKTFLKSGPSQLKANLAGTHRKIALEGSPFSSPSARLALNIRAETTPNTLKDIVAEIMEAYAEQNFAFEILAMRHLSPGRPMPTHHFGEIVT